MPTNHSGALSKSKRSLVNSGDVLSDKYITRIPTHVVQQSNEETPTAQDNYQSMGNTFTKNINSNRDSIILGEGMAF